MRALGQRDSSHRRSNGVLFLSGVAREVLAFCFLALRRVASFSDFTISKPIAGTAISNRGHARAEGVAESVAAGPAVSRPGVGPQPLGLQKGGVNNVYSWPEEDAFQRGA
ncbi:hypothetical protein LX32DRAFT_646972 [Colletotrichum zoysiae]|uniref:Uncharacterized protein n=1 Tax=Colletotrichum zoysiae TaxID=1216348 RepID=A0AAD9H324_9PEZI|nr:hypothetical protein LX32DRAFT_646972 [Colletotrichum zoysiae]